MTCRVLVTSPNGSSLEAHALLENGSTVSFIAERVVQSLDLSRTHQYVCVAGIADTSPGIHQSIVDFQISPVCELSLLSTKGIHRCYVNILIQLHGFSDVSEDAYMLVLSTCK